MTYMYVCMAVRTMSMSTKYTVITKYNSKERCATVQHTHATSLTSLMNDMMLSLK